MSVSDQGLYPAEHRGLRELYAAVRHLAGHWTKLSRRLGGLRVLEDGAAAARELLGELSERTPVPGFPAAQGVGARGAGLRGAGDVFLERNQALRAAVLDVQHVTTLLAYLGELASGRGDADLAAWLRGWETRLAGVEAAVRSAAVAQAGDPDAAIQPADPSALGRAGHSLASGLGTLGEAFDASRAGRAARRLRR